MLHFSHSGNQRGHSMKSQLWQTCGNFVLKNLEDLSPPHHKLGISLSIFSISKTHSSGLEGLMRDR